MPNYKDFDLDVQKSKHAYYDRHIDTGGVGYSCEFNCDHASNGRTICCGQNPSYIPPSCDVHTHCQIGPVHTTDIY